MIKIAPFESRDKTIAVIAQHLNAAWRPGEAIVALDEEYGYRMWFWFSGKSAPDLESWWGSLTSVAPYFMNPSIPENGAESIPGTLVQYSNLDDHKELWEYFRRLSDFIGHIHEDEDSYLKKTVYIRHKGFLPRG